MEKTISTEEMLSAMGLFESQYENPYEEMWEGFHIRMDMPLE